MITTRKRFSVAGQSPVIADRLLTSMSFRIVFAAVFFICSIVGLSFDEVNADEIIMKNGDRLQGKILSMGSGKLVFETSYAGKVTIAWDQVERLTSDETLEVSLPDKEILKGRAVKGEDGVLILEPESGAVTEPIAMSKVSAMSPPKPPPSWKWTGRASVGIDYQKGNTDKQSYTADLEVGLAKFPHRMTLYGETYYERNNGVDTENKSLVNFDYNRFFNKKWYFFGNIRGKQDEFSDLSYLGTLAAGAGYQFWHSEEKNLTIKLGPAYSREKYTNPQTFLDGGETRDYASGFWALDFDMWFFKRHLQFFHHDDLNFSFEDTENWRVVTRTGIRVPLVFHLFTSLQYNYDWVNQPADGKLHYDSRVLFKLGWQY
jgi:putative salt-induced outer membrane protein YdiY